MSTLKTPYNKVNIMDPVTGSTGQKTRLLIETACWFWNSIVQILAAAVRPLAWFFDTSQS